MSRNWDLTKDLLDFKGSLEIENNAGLNPLFEAATSSRTRLKEIAEYKNIRFVGKKGSVLATSLLEHPKVLQANKDYINETVATRPKRPKRAKGGSPTKKTTEK